MKSTIKKDTDWSIQLKNAPTKKNLTVTAVRKDGSIEFVMLRYPTITWALPKEKFLEHFEPTVDK